MRVHFDLDISRGELLRWTGATPMLIDSKRITGYIRSDGQMYDTAAVSTAPFDLSDPGSVGVRLLATDNAHFDHTIAYIASFEYVWEGRTEVYSTIRTVAPTSDIVVNL